MPWDVEVVTTPFEFDPEEFRAMIYANPSAERLRWWRATIDPTSYDPRFGTTQDGIKYLRSEQDTTGKLALVQGAQILRKYTDKGQIESGDLVITVMPDDLPIAEHDWIVPIGGEDVEVGQVPDARLIPFQEVLIRGERTHRQLGTVSNAGAAVTGIGTLFTEVFVAGDIIRAANQSARIAQVINDTHLNLVSADIPTITWAGNSFEKAREELTFNPAGFVDRITSGNVNYHYQTDFVLDTEGAAIVWLSGINSPVPGTRIAIKYRYFPKYTIIGDLGLRRRSVGTVLLPLRHVARLWKPETFR